MANVLASKNIFPLNIPLILYVPVGHSLSINKSVVKKPVSIILTLFIILFGCGSEEPKKYFEGEFIDGPANIRLKPNGRKIFSLHDSIQVETTPELNGWCEIGAVVKVDNDLIQKELFCLAPNSDIINPNGDIIGKTYDTAWFTMDWGDSLAIINGFTHIQNLKPNSIPERKLEHIIHSGKINPLAVEDFIREFRFEDYESTISKDIKEVFIYQSPLVDISPVDRITLLLRDEELIGILHTRPIKSKNFETYKVDFRHDLIITNTELPKSVIDSIVIKKGKFYSMID